VYELSPLRKADVSAAVEALGLSPHEFLKQVADLDAAPLANRPITLKFLLNIFNEGEQLPSRKVDLYHEGCCVLAGEWRKVGEPRLSRGLRFAIASRLAAALIFGGRSAIWTAPPHQRPRGGDIHMDDLLGADESFGRQSTPQIGPSEIVETLATALFRSRGVYRLGFAHQSYAEYMAAQYLQQRKVPTATILRLVFHNDGSDKVVPQLRDTAGWLAAMKPEICKEILAKDPGSLLLTDAPPLAEHERAELVRQLLRAYDSGDMVEERLVRQFGKRLDGARLKYAGIAQDLRPYIVGSHRIVARRVAIMLAELTRQSTLQQDLVNVALNEDEPYDVRTIAVVVIGKLGDETAKAQLKQLAIAPSENDPDDELKGGALLATWPNHLTAKELFAALSPPKKTISGLYQQFFWTGITSSIKREDMCTALDWALSHVKRAPSEISPLARVGVSIMLAGIDANDKPGVCERIADMLIARAEWFARDRRIAAKLEAHPKARRAVAKIAVGKAPDIFIARCLFQAGVVLGEDTDIIVSALDANSSREDQRKLAFLIGDILCTVPWEQIKEFDQVLGIVRQNPLMLEILRPVLGPIEWPSEEAKHLREEFEAERRPKESAPEPDIQSEISEIFAQPSKTAESRFESVCYCLLGGEAITQRPQEEFLPRWTSLPSPLQEHIIDTAAAYITGDCPVKDLAWIRHGHLPYTVMYGFWALRLICGTRPETLQFVSKNLWADWMPCVFGDPYSEGVVDERHEAVLKAAYLSAPNRFLEVANAFIDGQNQYAGSIKILDRLSPVWDQEVGKLLHAKLRDENTRRLAFEEILRALIQHGDGVALQFAVNLVTMIPANADTDVERPLAAAFQLLSADVAGHWPSVWQAIECNEQFESEFFTKLARDPYDPATVHLLAKLSEEHLADVYIRLVKKGTAPIVGFGVITPEKALGWLGTNVLNELAHRGTAVAYREIHRIQARLPDQRLEFVSKSTEDLVRRKTWRPLSTEELLSSILDRTSQKAPQEIVPASVEELRVPLSKLLDDADVLTTDPKLRKKLVAIVRHKRYFEELKVLKVASKRYQTPTLLQQEFPDLDVWAAMDDPDKVDVARGDFNPGKTGGHW
jgi:hypothetical protein